LHGENPTLSLGTEGLFRTIAHLDPLLGKNSLQSSCGLACIPGTVPTINSPEFHKTWRPIQGGQGIPPKNGKITLWLATNESIVISSLLTGLIDVVFIAP